MFWVDAAGYMGPDRRRARGLRLLERRRFDESQEAPSVAALLRHLHMRRLELELGGREALKDYIDRLAGVIALADDRDELLAALSLRALHRRMVDALDGDADLAQLSDMASRQIERTMALLVR